MGMRRDMDVLSQRNCVEVLERSMQQLMKMQGSDENLRILVHFEGI